MPTDDELTCAWCRRAVADVQRMVKGATASVCNDCVRTLYTNLHAPTLALRAARRPNPPCGGIVDDSYAAGLPKFEVLP